MIFEQSDMNMKAWPLRTWKSSKYIVSCTLYSCRHSFTSRIWLPPPGQDALAYKRRQRTRYAERIFPATPNSREEGRRKEGRR